MEKKIDGNLAIDICSFSCSLFRVKLKFGMLAFVEEEKPKDLQKNP